MKNNYIYLKCIKSEQEKQFVSQSLKKQQFLQIMQNVVPFLTRLHLWKIGVDLAPITAIVGCSVFSMRQLKK